MAENTPTSFLVPADKCCCLAFPTQEKRERNRLEQGKIAKQGGLGWALVSAWSLGMLRHDLHRRAGTILRQRDMIPYISQSLLWLPRRAVEVV